MKISHNVINGVSLVNFDGFAPASQWGELSVPGKPPAVAASMRFFGRKQQESTR